MNAPRAIARPIAFLREVAAEFGRNDCTTQAAALAYYTVFSLAPMMVVVIVIAGVVVSPDQATEALHGQFAELIGPVGANQVVTMVESVQADPGSSWVARILGTATLLFGASGVMTQLQAALNRTWDVVPDPSKGGARQFVAKRLLSFTMILGIAFLLLVSLVLTAVLSAIGSRASELLPSGLSQLSLQLLNAAGSFVVITVLFAAIFKILPEVRIRWRDVAVGALFTSALFTLGKVAIGLYLGNTNVGSAYGAASSLAILLVWIYYSSLILLIGAEFTQVWTRWHHPEVRAQEGAVFVESTARPVGQERAAVPPNR
ncbi:MAG: YihY/virulence factor BrkB family protein [Myxococcota bacterium]